MNRLLEVCVDSIFSLKAAIDGGADRIELCSSLGKGGLTPSYGFIKKAKELSSIPIFPLIRPRSGNFIYSDSEQEVILEDILMAKELGADGIVCGFLNENFEIDQALTAKAIEAATPLPFTFHRAFDVSTNTITDSVKLLKELGAKRILTSGKAPTAAEGLANLQLLVKEANNELTILAGSGVSSENVEELLKIGIQEVHASCSSTFIDEVSAPIKMGTQESVGKYKATDVQKVKALREAIS